MHEFQSDIEAVGRIDAVNTILDVICRMTGMGFAAVARVTEDRWIACQVLDNIHFGLAVGGELKIETTICNEIRDSREMVVIDDVAEDAFYRNHHTPAMYGLRSYISIPIILSDGRFFGTLCAIDPNPAKLRNSETIKMFTLFANIIASGLAHEDDLALAKSELGKERELSKLLEQFMAVLGHDLRNPLASINAGVKMLTRRATDDKSREILTLVDSSVARMQTLINDVMDLARARLGGGLDHAIDTAASVEPVLLQILEEARSANPDRTIVAEIDIPRIVPCDAGRIGQLASNLLGNALTHGAPEQPVHLTAGIKGQMFELAVANAGKPIDPSAMGHLFKPFERGGSGRGLGLGLYIASEIARLHGGTLNVASNDIETRFTFRMPLKTV